MARCFKTNSCEACPSAFGATSADQLSACSPAPQLPAEALNQITDASRQCNGKVVLVSTTHNEKRVPKGPGKWVLALSLQFGYP